MNLLAVTLAVVFSALAAIHVYWACGGTRGAAAAIPQHEDGRPIFRPGFLATLVVAGGLLAFAATCLARMGWVLWPLRWPSSQTALGCIAVIFAARTVGDFRHFGLMRRARASKFAQMDRVLYTPLCALLTLGSAWLALN